MLVRHSGCICKEKLSSTRKNSKKIYHIFREILNIWKKISKFSKKNLKNFKKKILKIPKILEKSWKNLEKNPKNLEKNLKNPKNLQKNLMRFLCHFFRVICPSLYTGESFLKIIQKMISKWCQNHDPVANPAQKVSTPS